MKMTPCAKLTTRMMPKISVSPQATKKRIAACDSALRHCVRAKLTKSKPSGAVAALAAVRRDLLARIDLHDLADRLGEILVLRHLHHEALVLALVVALAHLDRALDAGDFEVLHRRDDLHPLVRLSPLHPPQQHPQPPGHLPL